MSKKKEITLEEAKRLSIIKWTLIAENHGEETLVIEHHPDLVDITNNCGFCHIYLDNDCIDCPLIVNDETCTDSEHPYTKWYKSFYYEDEDRIELAKEVLELIKSIKV